MVEFDYSTIILIIRPVNDAAINALWSNSNFSRLVSFHVENHISSIRQLDNQKNRECTPYVSPFLKTQFHLKFNSMSINSTQGYVFENSDEKCDVVLFEISDLKKFYGINQMHFSIDFNWDFEYLRLNNISQYNIEIKTFFVKNDFQFFKYNEKHMLHPNEWTRIYVGSVKFELFYSDYERC